MAKLRVILVDDHPLFRQGLRRVLEGEPDIEVVGEIEDGNTALAVIPELKPDVVITDINLPGMNGLQITRTLKPNLSNTAFIILTAYHDDEQVFHAMRAGAAAYFAKDVVPTQLLGAVRQAANGNYIVEGKVMVKAEAAAWLLRHFGQSAFPEDYHDEAIGPLSPREMEILQQIALGRSNKEIAYHLGISRQTVKNHMTSILRKLDVNDRTQAALYAVRRGWIHLHESKAGET